MPEPKPKSPCTCIHSALCYHQALSQRQSRQRLPALGARMLIFPPCFSTLFEHTTGICWTLSTSKSQTVSGHSFHFQKTHRLVGMCYEDTAHPRWQYQAGCRSRCHQGAGKEHDSQRSAPWSLLLSDSLRGMQTALLATAVARAGQSLWYLLNEKTVHKYSFMETACITY